MILPRSSWGGAVIFQGGGSRFSERERGALVFFFPIHLHTAQLELNSCITPTSIPPKITL